MNISWVVLHMLKFSSVQFSHSVMSNSLRPHGLQHTRLPCLSPIPEFSQTHVHRVNDATQPSHPVIPFCSRLQSFPASGSFQMSQFFAWGGQSIGVSALASIRLMNIQDWFLLEWTGWISLLSKGLSRVFKSVNSLVLSFLYSPTLTFIHDYWKYHSFN